MLTVQSQASIGGFEKWIFVTGSHLNPSSSRITELTDSFDPAGKEPKEILLSLNVHEGKKLCIIASFLHVQRESAILAAVLHDQTHSSPTFSVTMLWIDYRDLPSASNIFSTLFLDYISNFNKIQDFYSGDFRKDADWRRHLSAVVRRPLDRSRLVQILSDQNRGFHCGVRALANIDSLLNDNTVAIVTGQQVGLFTGPLYTIYKTLTTLKLVESLSQRFPDYNFVPIFWLEGEDHDYEEVSSIKVINGANDVIKLEYPLDEKLADQNLGAVGRLEFSDAIKDFFGRVSEATVQTEFSEKVFDLFRTAYQRGMTFNKAFVHLMNVLLEDSGLIFLDPNDREVKQLVQPIFERELRETPKFCQLVIDQSAELEKQYHAQVKPKPLNLFLFHSEGRYLLEPRGDEYNLKGTRRQLSKDLIFNYLANEPDRFSPNVVLRPLCQDWLLPTAAYVAGPSEIAYFAQLKPLYQELGLPAPIIYPRASITIVEEKIEKVLDRFSLSLTDFFRDAELIKEKAVQKISAIDVEELFGGTNAALNEALQQLEAGLKKIDPTLVSAMQTAQGKIASHLEGLKGKTIEAQKRQHEVVLRQIEKAASHIYPSSNLQERELNILYFLNKYGMEFLRWLYDEMKIDTFKHQVIPL